MASETDTLTVRQEPGQTASERTIPAAKFIDDVEKFLQGQPADVALKELQTNYQTYKTIDTSLQRRKAFLMGKLPELTKTQAACELLIKKEEEGEEMTLDFELSEAVYSKVKLRGVKAVNLWLGANVMLEYPLLEAKELLDSNLDNCKQSIEKVISDQSMIKDFITTTEVNIARIYNFEITLRKKAKEMDVS